MLELYLLIFEVAVQFERSLAPKWPPGDGRGQVTCTHSWDCGCHPSLENMHLCSWSRLSSVSLSEPAGIAAALSHFLWPQGEGSGDPLVG